MLLIWSATGGKTEAAGMEHTPSAKGPGKAHLRSRVASRAAIGAGALALAFLAYGAMRDYRLQRELHFN
jgi:hypothetical protein